jgi:YhcH/YjgK/YiaL family protein
MIVTDLMHIERQVLLTPTLVKAIEFLRRPDIASLADGRVAIDGERVFALPQRYETIPAKDPRFEYHRKYIDLQYMAEGEEVIGWAPSARMQITASYDREKDITFGTVQPEEATLVRLRAGQLAVLYPEDAHAPRLAAGAPSRVFKIVVKVEVRGF